MLGVCGAKHVTVCVVREKVGQVAPDGREVGDDAVVHEDMAAEDEGMRVHLRDNASAACPDMGKDAVRFRVVTERFEVEVVDRWALGLVECWSRAGDVLNVG